MTEPNARATSGASRVIHAPAEALYGAFIDPDALLAWLPPGGMTGVMHAFDARVGGGYRMSLVYPSTEQDARGKTTDREDRVTVRFVELTAPRRIVEAVTFETDDPAFAGEMTLTVTFVPAADGTRVTLAFTDLPSGLRPEDNDVGARMSLEQLAQRFERQQRSA